uniref:tRNA carboxymethyluridine synthase n=1 Tax=Dermatophagoides pteronyssinus TaxID=6956 RepID=A0A6P6YC26_DERPT|nr:probable elongator complex protein 3 [Dermatophagoides pteronyssinus]
MNKWNLLDQKIARKTYKCILSKQQLNYLYKKYIKENPQVPNSVYNLEKYLITKQVRTTSGVCVITVLTSPGAFSCPMDCYYCPNEPGQPRSYLSTEPAVLRGNQCKWDPVIQFWDRAHTLLKNGHTIDKIELLVLGGTWSGYPQNYQEEFCRDLFFAANTFYDYFSEKLFLYRNQIVEPKTLSEEQTINENSRCKIIGLTLETRPDYINLEEIRNLRRFGCTRVQIGMQHTNDTILKYINRGHDLMTVKKAINLLKTNGFKVDLHIMLDLPGSDISLDTKMMIQVLSDPHLQVDQWKIYPCEVTPFSKIKEWFDDGIYIPYTNTKEGLKSLFNLILLVKHDIHPWIRLNRIIRDIPLESIVAGTKSTNMRQLLMEASNRLGWSCSCMRCREIRTYNLKNSSTLVIRSYAQTEEGIEYFISMESEDRRYLLGFCRLRLNTKLAKSNIAFDAFKDYTAYVRELHVYGTLVATTENKDTKDKRIQHSGVGSTLMMVAEIIAILKGEKKLVVIAGVGTRKYYSKLGFTLENTYMTKNIESVEYKNKVFASFYTNQYFNKKSALVIEHINTDEFKYCEDKSWNFETIDKILGITSSRLKVSKIKPQELQLNSVNRTSWIENLTIPKPNIKLNALKSLFNISFFK